MRALLVKLSSMGDLVQALPALTDAWRARPDVRFDWVVDEAFAEIPAWHPAVVRVITTAHRRWRRQPISAWRSGALEGFLTALRQTKYAAVIDAQTNFKSATVTWLARSANKIGPDKASVREWGAHFAYHKKIPIEKNQLAISRIRQLFAAALDYELPDTPPDFGLHAVAWPTAGVTLPDVPYLVFIHNASWASKGWPEESWRQLLALAVQAGYRVLLPWGVEAERQQALRIAAGFGEAQVLPRLALGQLAGIIKSSRGAVCVDTGLAHLCAALGMPTVTLYGPTDPHLIGATGYNSVHISAEGFACMPCYRRECAVEGYRGPQAQCLKGIAPQRVWAALQLQLRDSGATNLAADPNNSC